MHAHAHNQYPTQDPASESASLVGYDWVEEGGSHALHTPEKKPETSAPEPKTLPRLTAADVYTGKMFLHIARDDPRGLILSVLSTFLFMRVFLEIAHSMPSRGCGWPGFFAAAGSLFTTVPLWGLAIAKVYVYRVALRYRISETFTHLSRQRELINMNFGNFTLWAAVPYLALCYTLWASPVDSPIEQYVCMHPTVAGGPMRIFGSPGWLGDTLWTLRYWLAAFPLTVMILLTVRDAQEDAAKEAERRAKMANGGG